MAYNIRRQLTLDERNHIGGNSDLLAHLLFHRGITEPDKALEFLNPDYERDIQDPFLLKDAEKAAGRIIKALKNNQRIAIYSDYDADGIPAAVMFNDFFNRLNYKNYSIYIPHRHNEGFGLNVEAVEQLAKGDVKLIVTVDCGISDVIPVQKANELGIEVIITDHHEPPEKLPSAYAIVDHKQLDCNYPDKNLCGSAVGFKLIQAIIKKAKIENYNLEIKLGHEKWLLDMVGIATLSDMVPLIGENRIFAKYGLSVLRKSQRKGLIKLLSKLKMAQEHLTEDDIAFMITPRINAASRMGVPMDAFKLLTADNEIDAKKYADHLDEINNERKGIVASLVKEIKKNIKERYGENNIPSVIVMGNPDWRPSLLGLAANSCAEEFDRPVFLWGRDGDNIIKGSCRSEGKNNIVEIMRQAPENSFLQFGGHKHSGGFVLTNESAFFIEQKLIEAADLIIKKKISNSKNNKLVDSENNDDFIDMELKLDQVDWKLQQEIEILSPFGMSNKKPLFLFKKIVPNSVRIFGKTKEHIEIIFKKKFGNISAISFFGVSSDWADKVKENSSIDLVASIEKSMFRGRKELRLRVVDIIL